MDEPWDPRKAAANLRKHRVGFPEARTVEDDPFRIVRLDVRHSDHERRYHMLGVSNRGRILLVTCTYRGATMRPITARRATKRERHEYRHRPR